jgi:hypothetical protein
MVVFDVWESHEAWESFESDRLVPAITSEMEEAGVTEGPARHGWPRATAPLRENSSFARAAPSRA